MLKTIDRYILREILLPFTLGLVVLTFILVLPVVLKQGEALIAKGVAWPIIAHALFCLLPSQLSLAIPMSVLLGILIGLGRLSADREFVALQACGVSLGRLLRPLVLFALFATAFSAYETIIALPAANQTFREITLNVAASRVERNVTPGVFFEDFPNLVIYVKELPDSGGWKNVFLADTSQAGRTTVYFAREGRIRVDRQAQVVVLELIDGTSHTTTSAKPEESVDDVFTTFSTTLDPKTVFPPPPPKGAPELTVAELRARIATAATQNDPAYEYRFMIQQKFSLPITCPILALIGLALGASNRKDGKLASFVLGFAVIFVYYVLLFYFRALAKGGWFSPEWAPWVPNLIMAAAGVLLLMWRARSADQPIRLSLPTFWRRTADAPAPGSEAAAAATSGRVVLVVRLPHLHLRAPRMLDLYLARQYWRIVALTVLSLLGIFYISNFIDIADEMFRKEVTPAVVARYFVFQTPLYTFYIIPIAVLIATLVTVAVMTKNSELIVMRACGISLYRTMAPLVLFGTIAAASLFVIQEWILPTANREADRLNRIVRGYPPQTSPFNQRWIVGRNGAFYHYDLFDSTAKRFLNLWTYSVAPKDWRLGTVSYANEASLVAAKSQDGADFSTWVARRGWVRQFRQPKPDGRLSVKFDPFVERELTLESPPYFSSRPVETEQMTFDEMLTFRQLQKYIEQLRTRGENVTPYLVRLQRKVAFPFVTIIMTLLAVPFAASGGRRGALYGVGVGIVMSLAYFVTMSVFGALGSGEFLAPTLAAWAPNMLFGAAALYMILTVRT